MTSIRKQGPQMNPEIPSFLLERLPCSVARSGHDICALSCNCCIWLHPRLGSFVPSAGLSWGGRWVPLQYARARSDAFVLHPAVLTFFTRIIIRFCCAPPRLRCLLTTPSVSPSLRCGADPFCLCALPRSIVLLDCLPAFPYKGCAQIPVTLVSAFPTAVSFRQDLGLEQVA